MSTQRKLITIPGQNETFELIYSTTERRWFAQWTCSKCHSTFGSGEWTVTPGPALQAAIDGWTTHVAAGCKARGDIS